MESGGENEQQQQRKKMTSERRRAELRRRKLLLNSEERLNRIMGFSKSGEEEENLGDSLPPYELEKTETLQKSGLSKRTPGIPNDTADGSVTSIHYTNGTEFQGPYSADRRDSLNKTNEADIDLGQGSRHLGKPDVPVEQTQRAPRRGIEQYISRFDEAMKLRNQLMSEKSHENGGGGEEFGTFRVFRLVGSALLALLVRVFVCKYLAIFAPFLTLQLVYMGLSKYFPKSEKKARTTVLTAALLLSGIPAEVINRSMDTYGKMGDVFADLCVYFFSFIFSHEVIVFIGVDLP
ncbi:calcium signal-modulating cyclophilin ligand [Scyliorhinus canicula]|uniref:calcium signal-modulating cyclophilin ligand n=1 Tax=Scyliorhinus canicula TaxID=7830 RepID=UPI0018F47A71|nr:calcium signal-modulating cyclophilin ligand [Scyliorhinus canicula]